jgi:hypothetical protein
MGEIGQIAAKLVSAFSIISIYLESVLKVM